MGEKIFLALRVYYLYPHVLSLSLSFGFNICWYSTYLFPNAFLRIQRIAKKNSGLSRFFSFMEFSVIYWIRNNSPFLFYRCSSRNVMWTSTGSIVNEREIC